MSLDAETSDYGLPGAPEHVHSADEGVEMPASSYWPMALAFGVMLLFAGLVTHYAISLAGLLVALRAVFGWWHQVIPHEEHEFVPHRHPTERADPVLVSTHSVAHLRAGQSSHRVRIPEEIHPYSAGIRGGLAGGLAMAILACLYGQFAHGSIWYPINLLAAGVMPELSRLSDEALNQMNVKALLAAIIGHGAISMMVGLLYAVTLPMFPKRAPLWAGILAPVFWSGLVAASLELINPLLNSRINWPWFVVCQLGFGLVGGFVIARSEHIETMQSWPFAYRAGVESMGLPKPAGPEDENPQPPGGAQ
jgi:hypothetical protein